MPRVKKSHQQQQQPIFDDFPDPADVAPDFLQEEAEEPQEPPRQSRKKNRSGNGQHKPQRFDSPSPESPHEDVHEAQITAPRVPLSPPPSHSLLSQINFPSQGKSKPVNIREESTPTEKVSDQYTPPSDAGIADDFYGRSPHSVAISSAANTPPVEPGFSSRPLSKVRSPPISPPPRHARPVSFGGSIPPLPSHPQYPLSSYGSPPPHLPQAHFYGAHDIDLGLPKAQTRSGTGDAYFTKFVKLPGSAKNGIISGYDGSLNISSYDGLVVATIGALHNLPGSVIDAELFCGDFSSRFGADSTPLVAITVVQSEVSEGGIAHYRFTVSIYSLPQQRHVVDLLHSTPYPLKALFPGSPVAVKPSNPIRFISNGSQLVVSSAKSGEVFVFDLAQDTDKPFECLRKLWTSVQPREQPRGSSQPRTAYAHQSQALSSKFEYDENVPLMSISGRWLAVCPPASTTLQSAGMKLGVNVVAGRQAGLEVLSSPTRPTANVDVDSPDVDTLLGKVARGVAQHMMKAGNWLGEQGMQAWQSYWKKDDGKSEIAPQPNYTPAAYNGALGYGQFPPTHAEATTTVRDPDMVSIYDLRYMRDATNKMTANAPVATFQPPNGCSFLSFSPNGLLLLTASRKGDYQYVWDLLEMKSLRASHFEAEPDTKALPRVRQIARFDRLSSSVIVDVAWEASTLSKIALLTKNKTIHLLDIPASALRWPPPRRVTRNRPTSAPPDTMPALDHAAAPAGGFLANIASKTSPMLVSLRGRAPSTSGGLAGIGQAGFGIATATGARGSKAVASGLSKSLGAATETVSRMQHAGESRLHLKSEMETTNGRLIWTRRAGRLGISVLTVNGLKHYQTKKTRSRDARQLDTTVFEARKAMTMKLPDLQNVSAQKGTEELLGFWQTQTEAMTSKTDVHPLSYAEIDTNTPFQPFHSDRRVTMAIFNIVEKDEPSLKKSKKTRNTGAEAWVFGEEIATTRLSLQPAYVPEDFGPGSVIQRDTHLVNDAVGDSEQIVSTTRRRKPKHNTLEAAEIESISQEGFFEDDCDVLDFASDRV